MHAVWSWCLAQIANRAVDSLVSTLQGPVYLARWSLHKAGVMSVRRGMAAVVRRLQLALRCSRHSAQLSSYAEPSL